MDGIEHDFTDGVIHKTKADAERDSEHFDGTTTEVMNGASQAQSLKAV